MEWHIKNIYQPNRNTDDVYMVIVSFKPRL